MIQELFEVGTTEAAIVLGFTVSYAVASYLINVYQDKSIKFRPVKFGTTILVGLATAFLALQSGEALSPGLIVGLSSSAVYIVDQLLNVAMDDPPEAEPIQEL